MIITAQYLSDSPEVELRPYGAGWLPPLWFSNENAAIHFARRRFSRERLVINVLNAEGEILRVLHFSKPLANSERNNWGD